MTAVAAKESRCKFVAGDGAYQYLWFPRPLALEYVFMLDEALKPVSLSGPEDLKNDPIISRKYERCETVGTTVIYREVIR